MQGRARRRACSCSIFLSLSHAHPSHEQTVDVDTAVGRFGVASPGSISIISISKPTVSMA